MSTGGSPCLLRAESSPHDVLARLRSLTNALPLECVLEVRARISISQPHSCCVESEPFTGLVEPQPTGFPVKLAVCATPPLRNSNHPTSERALRASEPPDSRPVQQSPSPPPPRGSDRRASRVLRRIPCGGRCMRPHPHLGPLTIGVRSGLPFARARSSDVQAGPARCLRSSGLERPGQL